MRHPDAHLHPTGQAAVRRRLRPTSDQRTRSVTAAVLLSTQALIYAIEFLLGGSGISQGLLNLLLASTAFAVVLCLLVGPRLSPRAFAVAEASMILAGWILTGLLVAVTGGATSSGIALFANLVFYSAYFLTSRSLALQMIFGTAVIWAPLVYDPQMVGSSNFVARAALLTFVLVSMALVIARGREQARRAETELRHRALTDPLTGVANLHTFGDELRREVARTEALGGSLAVAFVDVNGLKAANTVHGHAGGDRLIIRTADALLAAAGPGDQVARVGGDEFAVMLPGADGADAARFEAAFAVALAEGSGDSVELSASIGSAVMPLDGRTFDELMSVADARMYDSKAALPTRLPTPGTAGGRSLGSAQPEEAGRLTLTQSLSRLAIIGLQLAALAALVAMLTSTELRAGGSGLPIVLAEVAVLAALLGYNRLHAVKTSHEAVQLARTDALTNLANRRVFQDKLLAGQAGADQPDAGGLILADVDDFKGVNSSGGHPTGDEVLKMIAAVLEGAAGPEATVCRIGGDEFAVIVDHGDSGDLARSAAKLRAAVGAVDWDPICEGDVTMSFGYASWAHVRNWRELVIAADMAMGISKQKGKDTVSAPQFSARPADPVRRAG